MAKSSLSDAAIRNQVYLERLKAAEARDYNKLLKILEKQVTDALSKLREPLSALSRAKLNTLLRELRAVQQAALDKSQDALLKRLKKLAAYEADFEAKAINTLTPARIVAAGVAADAAFQAALDLPLSATGDLLEPFVRDMTAREVDAVNKLLRRAHAEKWTNEETISALRGTKKLNFKDGLMYRMGSHNATLVRTAFQHAASAARASVWAENDDIVEKYRWVSTLDSHTTEQCMALDGQEFAIGEGPMPPIHMNCRSTTIPVLKGKLSMLSDGRTRASSGGPVDGDLTYFEWLKQQSTDFQDEALGPTRGQLFRDGGLSTERFAQLQLGRTFEPLTLEEMRKLEPTAFSRAGIE